MKAKKREALVASLWLVSPVQRFAGAGVGVGVGVGLGSAVLSVIFQPSEEPLLEEPPVGRDFQPSDCSSGEIALELVEREEVQPEARPTKSMSKMYRISQHNKRH